MAYINAGRFRLVGWILVAAAVGGVTAALGGGLPQTAAARALPVADPADDLRDLEGTWVRVSTDGREADRIVRMTVRRVASRPGGDDPMGVLFDCKWNGTSRNLACVDPAGTPRPFDFIADVGGVPEVFPGIYKLEGNVLTIAFRVGSPDRPKDFVAGAPGVTVDVYQRARP